MKRKKMLLGRDSSETVIERIKNDPTFASALLAETISVYLNGEAAIARLVLRDPVNGTIGFENYPLRSIYRQKACIECCLQGEIPA